MSAAQVMPLNVFIFNALCWTSAAIVFLLVGWQCFRQKRVTPLMVMSIAVLSIFWMEAPFDWVTWCQFAPELPRFPAWGPLGMTAGGLPLLAPPGYVMYIGIIVCVTVWITHKLPNR